MSQQPIFLRVFSGDNLVAVKQFNRSQIVLGKDAQVDIDLADPGVSNIHGMIEQRGEFYYLCDLGSKTGTKVNGRNVLDEKIDSGDVIELGGFRIEFYIGIPKPQTKPSHEAPKIAPPPDVNSPAMEQYGSNSPSLAPASNPESSAEKVPRQYEELTEQQGIGSEEADSSQSLQEDTPVNPVVPSSAPVEILAASNATYLSVAPSVSPNIADLETIPPPTDSVRRRKRRSGSYAPPAPYASADEIMQASSGPLLDVNVVWGDRVIDIYRIRKAGIVSIGIHPSNDISIPSLHGMPQKQPLVRREQSVSLVYVTSDTKGYLQFGKGQRISFSELLSRGRAQQKGNFLLIDLRQGELVKIEYGNRVSVFITHAGLAPQPILMGVNVAEIVAVIAAILLALLLYVLTNSFTSLPPEEPEKIVKVTRFEFNRREKPPKSKVEKRETDKKTPVVESTSNVKTERKEKLAGDPGARQALRPNQNKQVVKEKPASEKRGSLAKRAGTKAGTPSAKPGSEVSKKPPKPDMGLSTFFGTQGARERIEKLADEGGSPLGNSKTITGAGGGSGGMDSIDRGLRDVSVGSDGLTTVGGGSVKTRGKQSGLGDYGEGGFGQKGTSVVDIGGEGTEFVGTIDREAVRQVVMSNQAQIRACYEEELNKNFGLYGKVTITWEIQAQGRVGDASVKNTTLNNTNVEKCIIRRLKTWRFPNPPSGATATVSYPFVFSAR